MIVELACSATLIPAYNAQLFNQLVPLRVDNKTRNVVFIVCGGILASADTLVQYKSAVEASLQNPDVRDVWCNGKLWQATEQ